MAKRCLYYPFIHFRDEAWLKLSALHRDDVTRIVPRAYQTRDSRDIRVLEDAGIVTRLDPSAYEGHVTRLFGVLLEKHEKALVARYDIANRSGWSPNLDRFRGQSAASSRTLAFIHCAKLEPALVERFVELKLALLSRDRKWLGMHPSIVSAYMIALAAEISTRRGLSPNFGQRQSRVGRYQLYPRRLGAVTIYRGRPR